MPVSINQADQRAADAKQALRDPQQGIDMRVRRCVEQLHRLECGQSLLLIHRNSCLNHASPSL
ncbi:hypothetical protein ULG90_10325 [Halopseudomonas pachastrellae]|nr:hypothetical protein ULG90_10325 [Halopseudomonas pachastrellae]